MENKNGLHGIARDIEIDKKLEELEQTNRKLNDFREISLDHFCEIESRLSDTNDLLILVLIIEFFKAFFGLIQ